MRISDLSRQTGVPVATIKFYLREGLLPKGTPTRRNQAEYGQEHLHRLGLIRALTTIGQLDLAAVRELLGAINDDRLTLRGLYEVADRALFPEQPALPEVGTTRSTRSDVTDFLQKLGWQVDPAAAARFTHVVATLRNLGCECEIDFFGPYAAAAEQLAVQELSLLPAGGAGADRAAAVVRTILLGSAIAIIRRMAQDHLLATQFAPPDEPDAGH